MSIGKVRQRRQIVDPKNVLCEALRLNDEVKGGKKDVALIKPGRQVGSGDSLTPEESRLVRKGEAQLKKGEYVLWDDLKKKTNS